LLNTSLDPATRIYIGPNYYGERSYWNITVGWSNGYKVTFYRNRLTRYNSYVVYTNYSGLHMRQSFERAYARYNNPDPSANMLVTLSPNLKVSVGIPEKVNVAQNPLIQNNKNNDEQILAENKATKRTTRDLVFDDEEEESSAPEVEGTTSANVKGDKIAVKATVELQRNGETSTVLPTEPFQSGDKVRLLFSTNKDGYVYWLTKGTSGEYQVLYPTAKAGMDNSVVKNKEYVVPQKGTWRFDDNKGTETLVCLLAPEKISNLEEAVKLSEQGSKDKASVIVASMVDTHETKRTTRDLVFEEEDENDVNTKTQVTAENEPFVATYELEHN
jgi:hypothetical protein